MSSQTPSPESATSTSSSDLHEPETNPRLLSAIGWIGAFCIFIVIVAIVYFYSRPPAPDLSRIDERYRIKAEVTGQQDEMATTYGWVNQAEGVVRIPVDRAIELTVQELATAQSAEAEESAPAPGS